MDNNESPIRNNRVVGLLLEYADEQLEQLRIERGRGEWFYTSNVLADRFVRTDPFAWLCGVVFDQLQNAERSWTAPLRLKDRLGWWDVQGIASIAEERLTAAIRQKPALHRQPVTMAKWLKAAAQQVLSIYDGDTSRIWRMAGSYSEIAERLSIFDGIGPKKLQMALGFLLLEKEIDLPGWEGINVAPDTHVRRLFQVLGVVADRSVERIQEAATRIRPTYPGGMDYTAWKIGHEWCHAGSADCYGETHPNAEFCPLATACPLAGQRQPQTGNEIEVQQRIELEYKKDLSRPDIWPDTFPAEVRDLSGDRVYVRVECTPVERVTLRHEEKDRWRDLSNDYLVKVLTEEETHV